MRDDPMPARSTEHATFVVERTFEAPVARVFHAWADPATKARWFIGPDDWASTDHALDFRVGGREHISGGPSDAPTFSFDAVYQDIVPDHRIIYGYDMHMDGKRISVSLATIEFIPAGSGTDLIVTEQGVFLDGLDVPGLRERGTAELLDQLDALLQGDPAAAIDKDRLS
jgi:uncharacterized protein YndB with AHSA1/START domain